LRKRNRRVVFRPCYCCIRNVGRRRLELAERRRDALAGAVDGVGDDDEARREFSRFESGEKRHCNAFEIASIAAEDRIGPADLLAEDLRDRAIGKNKQIEIGDVGGEAKKGSGIDLEKLQKNWRRHIGKELAGLLGDTDNGVLERRLMKFVVVEVGKRKHDLINLDIFWQQ